MKKIINHAPIVRYRASVSEIFLPDSWNGTFSAESTFDISSRKAFLPPGARHRANDFENIAAVNKFLAAQTCLK
jgi:hypothetical protein